MGARVLIVEDEPDIRDLLAFHLEREGYHVTRSRSGADALRQVRARPPDLILLDLMLPELGGLVVCRRLRQDPRTASVPIVMLTARGEEVDRILGLELGADDYIVKPFSAREVAARIRAVLRRAGDGAQAPPASGAPAAAAQHGPLEIGPVRVDPARRAASVGAEELDLTRKEFELLALLASEAGSVISRERLIDEVWDTNWFGSTKTLDVHVSSLRRKLGDDSADPRFIHTVRGVGFRFASAEEL